MVIDVFLLSIHVKQQPIDDTPHRRFLLAHIAIVSLPRRKLLIAIDSEAPFECVHLASETACQPSPKTEVSRPVRTPWRLGVRLGKLLHFHLSRAELG